MIPYIKINKLHMDEIPGSEISLTGSKGDIIGITGLNGSGKTILAKYISGIKRAPEIGKMIIAGLDPYSILDQDKLRRKCGVVYQDPRTAVVFEQVGKDIVFGAENQGIESEKIKKKVRFFTNRYDLKKKTKKNYNTLSGSEQQRAAVSAILMMNSEILVLDEPFSMQGIQASKRYMEMIIKSARKRNQTLFVFSKQREILEQLDIVYEMRNGALVEIDIDGMQYRDRHTTDETGLRIERYISGGDLKSGSGISLHNVSFGYDDTLLIYDQNARFEAGSAYRITGAPGCGKTTLLQLIGGLLRPYEGEVFIGDDKKTGYVFQYPEDGFVESIVLDDVMFGPMSEGISKREARGMAEAVLEFVGVREELWGKPLLELSIGEQKLVSIAGALALSPDFILMDEPYAGLDVNSCEHIESIINGLCAEGKCIITVEG